MDTREYPRILIVTSNSFNLQTGGGTGNTNLFRGWPREKIATLHNDSIPSDTTVCGNFYYLGSKEFKPMALLAWFADFFLAHSFSKEFLRKCFYRLAKTGLWGRVVLSRDLETWINRFQPEILYSSLGNLIFLRLIEIISERYQIPMIIHMLDDWPECQARKGLFSIVLRRRMNKLLRKILSSAVLRFGICSQMCQAYERRYQVSFQPLISRVESEDWRPHAKKRWSYEGAFRVVYMGTVYALAQLESLVDIGKAIASLIDQNINICFEIYTPAAFLKNIKRRMCYLKGVTFNPSPPNTQAPVILSHADLLVIPVNFDKKSFRYIQYSFPGKTTAYMISGTPVLLYGPQSVPPIEYAKNENWGFVVSERNIYVLSEKIKTIMSDESLRQSMGQRAHDLALQIPDNAQVRKWFHESIRNAAHYSG